MILIQNTRIFDGSGSAPFAGEVLIKDKRIAAVMRAEEGSLSRDNATVIDAMGERCSCPA
jgi:N-acyl-D-aspartate/D-glutamate deacylase